MRLIDAPVGVFRYNSELVLKTEYMSDCDGVYIPDCYILSTGEKFWGGMKSLEDFKTKFNSLEVEVVDVRTEQRWIPCSERLPEYGKTVLWCNDKGSIFTTAITYMNGTSWAVGKRHRRCQMVAWMPLPEPRGKEND